MLVRHALKTAFAATILGAIFQESHSIDIIHYPAMGLVATMQSSLGGTVKAAWGRLGGSVIAGIIGAILLSAFGGGAITAGLAFIIASIACEICQLPTLYGQAGAIAALIGTAVVTHGGSPWLYAFNRVYDNGIGILIGIFVTTIFWADNPRKTLFSNLVKILSSCDRLFESIITDVLEQKNPTLELDDSINTIKQTIEQSESLLTKSMYGFIGQELVQDNWSDLLASQRRILRYLLTLFRVYQKIDSKSFITQFYTELTDLSQHISKNFTTLIQKIQSQKNSTPLEITLIKTDLQIITDKIRKMREERKTRNYSISEVMQFYTFINTLTEFVQELEQLEIKLTTPNQLQHSQQVKNKKKFNTVKIEKLKHIFKTGITASLTLVILNNFLQLPFNYYALIGVIIAMQPTLGKGITAGSQRVICTAIGAIFAVIIINTLGANYLTLGLGVALTIMTSSYLGFNQGYHPGCFIVIIAILAHSNEVNIYIWSRFIETFLGVLIGVVVSIIFATKTSANQLDTSLKQNFSQLEKFYTTIVNNYIQGTAIEIEQLNREIWQSIQQHTQLQSETQKESFNELTASKKQRLWNFLIGHEKELYSKMMYLDNAVKKNVSSTLILEFNLELQEIVKTTSQGFKNLNLAIDSQVKQPSYSLLQPFEAIEEKLMKRREAKIRNEYSLDEVLNFFAIIAVLKEIAEEIEQITLHFPSYSRFN